VQEYANLITNQAALLKQLEQSGTALGKEFYKIEQQRAQVADLFRRNPILGEFDLSAPILQSKNQLSEYTRLQAAMQSIERDLSAGRRVSDSRLATFETKRQKTEDVFKKLGIYDQFDIGPEVFNQLKAKNVGLFAQADSTGAIQRGFEDIRNKVERERTSLEKALADKGQLSIGRVGGFNQRTIAANTQTAGLGQLQQFRQVNNRQLKEVADYYSSIDKSASELSTKGTVTATKLIALGNKQREVSGQYFDAFGKELDLPKFRASIERIREVVSLQKEVQRFASQQGGVAPEKIENLTKRATTLRNVLGSFRVATDLEKFDSFINLKALQPSAALAGISSQFEALGKSIEEQRTKLKTKLSATGSLSILEIAGFNQKVSQANTQTAGLANFQQLNQLAADQVTEVQKFLKRRAGLQQALDIKGALPLGSLQRLDDDNKKLNASLKNLGINFNVPSLKVSIDQLKEVQDLEGEAKKIATLGSQATKEQITDFTQRRKNLEEILRQSNLTTDLYSKVAAGSTQQQGFLSRIGNAIRSRLGSGVGAGASGGFGGGAGGGGGWGSGWRSHSSAGSLKST
jgi:hypothetical protein